jgi:hypothetical protein
MAIFTGTYGGGGIATPTLAVVDQGDGTGATATIADGSATATNTVYASQDGTTWTAVGSLVGNGTVDLSLAVGRWWVYVHAVEGAATANSIVHAVNVTSAIADPTPANCLAAVAAAVAVKLNAGKTAAYFARNDFTATVAADTDLLLEAAGSDVLHVDVATGDVKTEYITRASRAFDCRADVCLRIRPSAMTVAERDALSALLGELEDYLKPIGGDPCTLDTYADAIWTASEIRAPWVPDHWRDERQYTGIFSVTFRVYAD